MITVMKKFLRERLDGKLLGALDYYRFRHHRDEWEGDFNRQEGRQEIFLKVIKDLEVQEIVETGTFRGSTTEYMFQSVGLPIHTVEFQPRFFAFAKMRLKKYPSVKNYLGDSRQFLRKFFEDNARLRDQRLFFYLDAHWNEDLPLAEELEIIFKNCKQAIVMVDDFQVPGDEGYTYDDYGPGKSLCLDYLDRVKHLQLTAFFPMRPSAEETGAKRGAVVLASDPDLVKILCDFPILKTQKC